MRSSRSQMQPFARHWPTGRPSGTVILVAASVVTALAQLSCWLFDRADPLAALKLFSFFGLSSESMQVGRLWQLASFTLLHAHPLHLILNVAVLYLAGREVEPIVGPRHFIGLYLAGNLLGGLAQWAAYATGLAPAGATMVGISAGVAAILAAYATILPELEITGTLFFILPFRTRAKVLGVGVVFGAALLWIFAAGSPLGPAAILAGCGVGWAYAKQLGFGNPLAIERYLCDKRQHAARMERMPADQFIREEIDPILEKIARSGAASLSRAEKKLLAKGREKLLAPK